MSTSNNSKSNREHDWKRITLTAIKENADRSNNFLEFKHKATIKLKAWKLWKYIGGDEYKPPVIPELLPSGHSKEDCFSFGGGKVGKYPSFYTGKQDVHLAPENRITIRLKRAAEILKAGNAPTSSPSVNAAAADDTCIDELDPDDDENQLSGLRIH